MIPIAAELLVKATVILALGLTAARLARPAQASVRHLLHAATFAALILLPIAALTVPNVVIEVSVPGAAGHAITSGREDLPAASPARAAGDGLQALPRATPLFALSMPTDWRTVVRWSWIGGAVMLLASLFLALARVSRLRRTSVPRPELRPLAQSLAIDAGIRRPIEVLEHESAPAPMTCGVSHPAIVLPIDARNWEDAALRRALVHELEHVRRRDWAMQLIARAVCACYWFHPLVWMAWRALCLEAERACDDAVVRSAERTDYADQLVLLARRISQAHAPAILGMANRSDLATRVAALLDDGQRRGRAGLFAASMVSLAAALVVAAIAPMRAVAAPAANGAVVGAAGEQTSRRPGDRDARPRRIRGLDRALYEAAESGAPSEIEELIRAGADVNAAIDGDGSPLIAAAREGRSQVVRLLLDRGADVNMAVRGDGNPLIMAAREGFADVVALLLDRGARIDEMVPDDENALIQASGSGQLDVVRLLIGRGADVNARAWAESAGERLRGEWRTPLSMARRGGHHAVVAALLAAGARE